MVALLDSPATSWSAHRPPGRSAGRTSLRRVFASGTLRRNQLRSHGDCGGGRAPPASRWATGIRIFRSTQASNVVATKSARSPIGPWVGGDVV